jgi:hypothetical protein
MVNKECNICCEKINSVSRVKCPFCLVKIVICIKCTQKYLLESEKEAHCMSCKHEWSLEFCNNSLGKLWYNREYAKSRTEKDFEREMGLMVEAMPFVQGKIEDYKFDTQIEAVNKQLDKLRDERKKLYAEKYKLIEKNKKDLISVSKPIYMFNCPINECKGFIEKKSWKCSICNSLLCKRCHVVKEEEHECKKSNIENAKEIMKSTKPCPKCAVRIFKIEGCDQMYCVQCLTPFSWKTGEVETGTIHNPHYYEILKKINGSVPRQPGDIPCGGLPDFWIIDSKMNRDLDRSNTILYTNAIQTIYRIIGESDYLLRKFNEKTTVDLRIDYLANIIDKKQFISKLSTIRKHNKKTIAIRDTIQLFKNLIIERLQSIVNEETLTKEFLRSTIKEIVQISVFCNEELEKTLTLLGSKLKVDLTIDMWLE